MASYSNLSGFLTAAPDFLARLNAALRAAGVHGRIADPLGGYRTGAQEDMLNRTGNLGQGGLVGTSSTSMHVTGYASDVEVNGRPIREVVSDAILRRFQLIAPYGNDEVHVEDRRGLSWARSHPFRPGQSGGGSGVAWSPCTLTWYDPALGGTNSSSGRADPTSATASGEPYNARAYTCAAPERFAFGTQLMFRYRKRVVTCKVNDRGGAISGVHFDLSRIAAEKLGIIQAGVAQAEYAPVGAGRTAPASGITRPGGAAPDSSGAGLEALYQSFLDEGKKGDTTFAAFTSATSATRKFVSFIPGLPLPGLPLPDIPGIPNLPDFNPFDLFKQGTEAVTGVGDFLKLVGWLINPRNILRMLEFIVGLSLLFVGVRINLNVFRDAANERTAKLLGKRKGGKKGKQGRAGRSGQRGEAQQRAKKKMTDALTPGVPGQKAPSPTNGTKPKPIGGKGGKAASSGGKAAAGSRAGSIAKTAIKIAPK